MEKNCKVISDLLPLYLDEACSDESKKIVEDHLKECEECRLLAEDMKKSISDKKIPAQNDAQVLKKTAWIINKRAVLYAFGTLLIIVYWLVFFLLKYFTDMHYSRYLPSNFIEIYGQGLWLVPIITFLWFAVLFIKTAWQKLWKKNFAYTTVLLLLLTMQVGFWINAYSEDRVLIVSEIYDIPDSSHIVIKVNDTYATLSTPPLVTNLLETDGTRYSISYNCRKNNIEEGELIDVYLFNVQKKDIQKNE